MKHIIPKLNTRFIVSWCAGATSMFALFYTWHGLVLNDFIHFNYRLEYDFIQSLIFYFAIGFLITSLVKLAAKTMKTFRHSAIVGASIGVLVYLVSIILGTGFNDTTDSSMMLMDLSWQVIEQGAGGFVCGWLYRYLFWMQHRTFFS